MNRHDARILVVMTLTNLDILYLPLDDYQEKFLEIKDLYCEYVKSEEDFVYAEMLLKALSLEHEEIDKLISNYLVGYTLDRLNHVDRNIIRLATMEMKNKLVDRAIAINEAILICKEYSSLSSDEPKFLNRVLDNIAGGIYGK